MKVTQAMIERARRAEFDFLQRNRLIGADRFVPTADEVIPAMLEAGGGSRRAARRWLIDAILTRTLSMRKIPNWIRERTEMEDFWTGAQYGERHLLLLGESAYSWIDEEGIETHPSPRHAKELVERAIQGDRGRFMSMLTRGLAGVRDPSPAEVSRVWSGVAFFNYIVGTVGQGPRVRPTQEQWNAAALAFPGLLAQLAPRNVVVLGKAMWSKMPDADYWLTDDVQGYRLPGGGCVCWAVPHPSGGLSWQRLTQMLAFAERRELIEP
jgi:hypothetical protein